MWSFESDINDNEKNYCYLKFLVKILNLLMQISIYKMKCQLQNIFKTNCKHLILKFIIQVVN